MLKRFLFTAAVLACPVLAPAQETKPAPRPQDGQAQGRKAQEGRRDEAKARRAESKESREPGVRCSRYRGKP